MEILKIKISESLASNLPEHLNEYMPKFTTLLIRTPQLSQFQYTYLLTAEVSLLKELCLVFIAARRCLLPPRAEIDRLLSPEVGKKDNNPHYNYICHQVQRWDGCCHPK